MQAVSCLHSGSNKSFQCLAGRPVWLHRYFVVIRREVECGICPKLWLEDKQSRITHAQACMRKFWSSPKVIISCCKCELGVSTPRPSPPSPPENPLQKDPISLGIHYKCHSPTSRAQCQTRPVNPLHLHGGGSWLLILSLLHQWHLGAWLILAL